MEPQEKNKTVLITGGSGLIGKYLTSKLLWEGFTVVHLSRKQDQFGRVRVYRWDPTRKILNKEILSGVDYIIHLAGANIGEKRWSKKRKMDILSSRVGSAELLHEVAISSGKSFKAFISASAIGYYGAITSETIFSEEDHSAEDFLGTVCKSWEGAADSFSDVAERIVKIRTGVVLEKSDSALSKLLLPARFGIFPIFGSGRQYMPCIHIQDLVNVYFKAIIDVNMKGAYNAVAPFNVTNREFVSQLSKSLGKRSFAIPVPGFVLKVALGEMSDVVLKGSRISADKIIKAGYRFEFDNLPSALNDTLKS